MENTTRWDWNSNDGPALPLLPPLPTADTPQPTLRRALPPFKGLLEGVLFQIRAETQAWLFAADVCCMNSGGEEGVSYVIWGAGTQGRASH